MSRRNEKKFTPLEKRRKRSDRDLSKAKKKELVKEMRNVRGILLEKKSELNLIFKILNDLVKKRRKDCDSAESIFLKFCQDSQSKELSIMVEL